MKLNFSSYYFPSYENHSEPRSRFYAHILVPYMYLTMCTTLGFPNEAYNDFTYLFQNVICTFSIHMMPYNEIVHGLNSTSQGHLIEQFIYVKLYFRGNTIFVKKSSVQKDLSSRELCNLFKHLRLFEQCYSWRSDNDEHEAIFLCR